MYSFFLLEDYLRNTSSQPIVEQWELVLEVSVSKILYASQWKTKVDRSWQAAHKIFINSYQNLNQMLMRVDEIWLWDRDENCSLWSTLTPVWVEWALASIIHSAISLQYMYTPPVFIISFVSAPAKRTTPYIHWVFRKTQPYV